ncbi:hypothetical protein [Roseateles saccharophilus]|uniref:Uncharacterized protein n=1 Tax=Roseateles saccharophilus TaxID=304 RepID=A0A4R3U8J2_ROSSA|nr:hypothetical protein [Roseateles saccharophilus]MDG0835838.1 hypothetical protein [Roseateles saccharophilus]TCU83423.1 hypothetical protein EV671_105815 [Roseateles saccharophilus]
MLPADAHVTDSAKMTPDQHELVLVQLQQASNEFYRATVHIGNHPFIEFAGLMNKFIDIVSKRTSGEVPERIFGEGGHGRAASTAASGVT